MSLVSAALIFWNTTGLQLFSDLKSACDFNVLEALNNDMKIGM